MESTFHVLCSTGKTSHGRLTEAFNCERAAGQVERESGLGLLHCFFGGCGLGQRL